MLQVGAACGWKCREGRPDVGFSPARILESAVRLQVLGPDGLSQGLQQPSEDALAAVDSAPACEMLGNRKPLRVSELAVAHARCPHGYPQKMWISRVFDFSR